MSLNGVRVLDEKIHELKDIYSDFRLDLFKAAYPNYQQDPRRIEPGLRCDLGYFLKRVDGLLQALKDIKEPIPETKDPIESFKTIVSGWGESRVKQKTEYELDEEDIEKEMIFKLEI